MKFAEPLWLYVGAAACVGLIFLFRAAAKSQLERLENFAAKHLLPELTTSVSKKLRILKEVLWVIAIACFFIALARPQYGFRWEESKRYGIDLLFAIDTSKSMLTEDIKPNRLERAKLAVTDLVRRLGNDRCGLIAFAGEAFLQCPLTLDQEAFFESLDALDTQTIAKGGTNISSAIIEAENDFNSQPGSQKFLILLTDGEDLEGDAIAVAQEAGKKGVKIFTIGIGTPAGEVIPVKADDGSVSFLKDENGQIVKSRLDEAKLRQLAQVTGGRYEPLGESGEGLEKIYDEEFKSLPQQELTSRQEKVFIERFQWPLSIGILCLIAELLIAERKALPRKKPTESKIRPVHHFQPKVKNKRMPVSLILIFFIAGIPIAKASPWSAEEAYKKGKYDEAWKQFQAAAEKSPDQPKLQYNEGAAAYKSGKYTEAEKAFKKSFNQADLKLQENAYYNLGNTLYREGEKTEKSDRKQTIAKWEKAVESYEGALQLKKDDADAQFNRDFVKKKLEDLKQQQNQQQQKQDQQQQQQNQQNQQSSSGQQKQDQSSQGQSGNSGDQNKEKQQQNQNQASSKQQNGSQQQPQQQQANQQKQNGNQGTQQPQPQPKNENGDQEAEANAGDASEKPEEGRMSKAEAKNLLDSLKDEEMTLPLAHAKKDSQDEEKPAKDW